MFKPSDEKVVNKQAILSLKFTSFTISSNFYISFPKQIELKWERVKLLLLSPELGMGTKYVIWLYTSTSVEKPNAKVPLYVYYSGNVEKWKSR